MKIIKIITIGIVFIALFGCGKEDTSAINTNENMHADGAAVEPSANENLTDEADSNENVRVTENNSPRRIAFNKGSNWGAVNITLAAGEAQKFVIGAKSGQNMRFESSSKGVSINLIKGNAETTESLGFLNAELQSNGDYIVEVRNSSKKEVKTSVRVTIKGGTDKPIDIGEEDAKGSDQGDD